MICERIHIEKDQLLSKIAELELKKASLEELGRQSEVQKIELKEQVTSSVAASRRSQGTTS